jgi:hypothetical protein
MGTKASSNLLIPVFLADLLVILLPSSEGTSSASFYEILESVFRPIGTFLNHTSAPFLNLIGVKNA